MQRRDFLRLCGYSSLAMMFPGVAFAGDPPKTVSIDWKRSVVLIELRGGNDGLNTVVPYADPAYAKARPAVAIPAGDVLKLDKQFGLNPVMGAMLPAWKDGDLAIVHAVGYDHPNRSHFRGIDIWNSGSKADEMQGDGWAARVMSKAQGVPDDLLAHSIILGYDKTTAYGGFGPLYGDALRNIIMNGPDGFIREARAMKKAESQTKNPALQQVLKVQADINASGERMAELVAKAPALKGKFPKGQLGDFLQTTAKLIIAGAVVPMYKLTIDGFDTHSNQRERQDKLLTEVSEGLGALREALMAGGAWDRTLVGTYSEFGRRVSENGSKGTDHGTAAPHFLTGGKVKGGFIGAPPSLTELNDGDLVHTNDFRSLYMTMAQEWWGYSDYFLSQKGVKALGCIKA